MSEQQIKEYLEKYNITSKELLAKHIEELKRNTKPNTKLISELVWVLEDFFFSFFERSSCPAEKGIENWNIDSDYSLKNRLDKFVLVELERPQKRLSQHVSEAINSPFFLDEETETSCCKSKENCYCGKFSEQKSEKEESLYVSNRLLNQDDYAFPEDSEIHKESIKTSNITTNGEIISQDEYSVTIDFSKTGIKESNGKTDYSEIDWDFIETQALRMNKNKGKYEAGNYKKPMNINLLKQSLLRHVLEVLKDNYQDDGDELGHLSAIALNAQFLHYQLKNNVK